ncbi:MAG: hypothetical protein Q9227_001311 [Pyrenula ochraceoflavens]
MASRKLQQDIDKTFKKVAEGIEEFNAIHEKILASTNAAQKEKQEDLLKREIKKLQRLRDQIKTWAAGNEVKDKGPLLDHRKKIEKCMEQFKAVEKEMKTKAFSKEGLLQGGKQDPREKEREDLCDYLSETLDEIQRILETFEAEEATLQTALKKKQRDAAKADRLADIHTITDRFKWHEGKIELLRRALQNDSVEASQVADLKDEINYVLTEGQVADFEGENDAMYDDFNLDAEEATYGMNNENDKMSSQDTQSVSEPDPEPVKITKVKSEPTAGRRPSTQLSSKSPVPQLATLVTAPAANVPLPPLPKDQSMKPAPIPTRQPGETMKWAAAAATAAASDKNGVGIAPLPPPPSAGHNLSTTHPPSSTKAIDAASPSSIPAYPVEKSAPSIPISVDGTAGQDISKSPSLSQASASGPAASVPSSLPQTPAMEQVEKVSAPVIADESSSASRAFVDSEEEESIYHLPPGLEDLVQSFETAKSRKNDDVTSSAVQKLLSASQLSSPEAQDADRPRHYKPNFRYNTPAWYPQEPLHLFDDPRMYENGKVEPDTLFYIFYYRQGTYQQYLAAKALKSQSWRFHKQYQTWFQRHEEPKTITEEFEQGTYRFFDYESTWYGLPPSLRLLLTWTFALG